MDSIFLGLGSNLGDRAANLATALERITAVGVHVLRRSSLYETAPMDIVDQPSFLNSVVEVSTDLEPPALLQIIQQVESSMGRVRVFKSGPRIIDIDILVWGVLRVDLPDLQIPHPSMFTRRFVLEPLAELKPGWQHPFTGESILDLIEKVRDQRVERVLVP